MDHRYIPYRCNRFRAVVSLELDGELSHIERAFLRSHGASCAACRSYRAGVTATTRSLRSAPLEVPERRVVISRPPRRIRSTALRPFAVAASAVVVAFGALAVAGTGDRAQDTSFAQSSARPAYYDSPEYELSMLKLAQHRDLGGRGVIPI